MFPSVLLVEDQNLLRLGLRLALEAEDCCTIVGESIDGETAVQDARRLRPDVVLMDLGLPRLDGVEATWQIKQSCPHTRIVMFTSHTDTASAPPLLARALTDFVQRTLRSIKSSKR